MSTSVGPQDSKGVWQAPEAELLSEAAWQAWLAKGIRRDKRSSAALAMTLKCVLVAVLLLTALAWTRLLPFEVVVRFIVSAAAIILMAQDVKAKRYVFGAIFGMLVVLYNPVAPVFALAGDWQRVLVIASTAPIIVSLGWLNERQAGHE